jgi:hypothetical protein
MNNHQRQRRVSPIHKTITIGELRKRANKHLIQLMSSLASVNDVEINIASNSTFVILFGYSEDIAACETLWINISHKMVQSGEQYLDSGAWRTESTAGARHQRKSRTKPASKQTARNSYYTGFIASLSAKLSSARDVELARAKERSKRHTNTEPPSARTPRGARHGRPPTSTALALQNKSEEVAHYYRTHSTARGTWSGSRRVSTNSTQALAAGRRDGKRFRLGGSGELSAGARELSR